MVSKQIYIIKPLQNSVRDEIGIHVRKRMTHEKILHNLNKKHVIFQKKNYTISKNHKFTLETENLVERFY